MRCGLCEHFRSSHGYGVYSYPCGVVSFGIRCDCPGYEPSEDEEED